MRFRSAILLLLTLVLAGCKRESFSRSNSGFSALEKTVLYDFRSMRAPSYEADSATRQKVLPALFPAYLPDTGKCQGQSAPRILGSADGSFTASGLKQSVYLVDSGECGQSVKSRTRRLAVFTSGKLTANAETAMGTALLGAYDLDRDGKNELLLEDGGRGTGERVAVAKLVEFQKEKLETVEDLGEVYSDPCEPAVHDQPLTARVFYYLPPPKGQKARFTVEVYRAPCPAHGKEPQWTRAVATK